MPRHKPTTKRVTPASAIPTMTMGVIGFELELSAGVSGEEICEVGAIIERACK